MNTSITFEYSLLWLIPCFIVALLYAYLLYQKDFKNIDSPLWKYRTWLAGFRFSASFLLLILLLTPFIKSKHTERQKPVIAILADKSESIRNGFKNKADTAEYFSKLKNIADDLSGKYEVAIYGIGDKLENNIPNSLQDKTTNLSSAFEMINDVYYNKNLGAVILATDGIFNQGINPLYTTENSSYEIYSIAMGDTTTLTDIKIENVYYNKIAYLNDQLVFETDLGATNAAGNNTLVSVYEIENGQKKLIEKKNAFINSNYFLNSFEFDISTTRTGVIHYQITASTIKNEVSYSNNTKDIYIEVLDGRQKILLIASAPHPDIAALKSAIGSNKNYSLDVVFADDFNAKLNDYSLVILHQLPAINSTSNAIIGQVKAAKKPVWWITSSGTNIAQFNKEQSAVSIIGNTNKFNDATAYYNSDFSLFALSENTLNALAKFPPLYCFFGDYKTNPSGKNLFTQKINNVKTDFPMWGFIDDNDIKSGLLCGEGIWRWKLYDFLQNQNNDAFNEIVNKTVQYLAVINDKRPFRVNLSKNVFDENEAVNMDAQLYNASFELINTADVDLKVADDSGKIFDFKFNKNEKSYSLNLGFLPAGNYKYQAKTNFNNQNFTAEGKFSVAKLQLEDSRTVADHNMLRQLALSHKGISTSLEESGKITKQLLSSDRLKTVLHDTYSTESAINLLWIFGLLIMLLSLEWVIRKYSGAY